MYRRYLKPLMDFAGAFMALLVLLPVGAIISLLLLFTNNGSPFFIQQRAGKHGRIFRLIKFRTMNNKRDERGDLLSDSERLTRVGKFIRRTSLDEIPQIWNVLMGEMSFVGPRPLLVEYLPLYSARQNKRHEVKPGITGWAQVNGRNTITWEQKFDYDVWYVDHLNFALDLRILLLTLTKTAKQEGIHSASSVTMEKFAGNNK